MNTAQSALDRIDKSVFGGELDKAFIWASLEAKTLLLEQGTNRAERQIKLAKAIETRYPGIGTKGQVLLAALAMCANY